MKPVNDYYVKEYLKLLRETVEIKVQDEELYKDLMQKSTISSFISSKTKKTEVLNRASFFYICPRHFQVL